MLASVRVWDEALCVCVCVSFAGYTPALHPLDLRPKIQKAPDFSMLHAHLSSSAFLPTFRTGLWTLRAEPGVDAPLRMKILGSHQQQLELEPMGPSQAAVPPQPLAWAADGRGFSLDAHSETAFRRIFP